MNEQIISQETTFIDCLTCNEITEADAVPDTSICYECGDSLVVTPA